jgi:Common central domain of tyrosinase
MKVVMRQNQSSLDATQKANFVQAVLNMKAAGAYDEFVAVHRDTVHIQPDGRDFNDAHRGPAFFPWHRGFLQGFEWFLGGASGDETMGLPYWDWSVDDFPDFLGGNGSGSDGKVMDGEFAYDRRPEGDKRKWTLTVRIPNEEKTPWLKRQFGNLVRTLPTPADVTTALERTPYDVSPWDDNSTSGFRNRAEGFIPYGMHNRVHAWVGGSMMPVTSPNDPVFFLHHCFIDKLWVDWQDMQTDPKSYYLPTVGARKGHNLGDAMPPWKGKPSDVLNHRWLGYRYDTEPYLLAFEELYPGQWIWSADKSYYLYYGNDGILLLARSSDDQPLWRSSHTPKPVGRCMMRQDGNLVIYDPSKGPFAKPPIWELGTTGHMLGYLKVENEGKVLFYPYGETRTFYMSIP